jgi:hypothetical protein
LAAAFLWSHPAHASEAGASFYLLGSGGPDAAILPPLPGVFFDNTIYHYSGKASASREFLVGGNLVAGLRVKLTADFATLLWVPTTDFAGGTLALGGALALGQSEGKVTAVITGPRGGQVTISTSDKATMLGDPVMTAALGWKLKNDSYVSTTATLNIPIGHYREGELANVSFHRWLVDWSTAFTWHDPKRGWDVSAKAGLTFNGTNQFTDYNTGMESHIEGSVERLFSKSFSAGVQAYRFQQLTGDSGSGATLGSFKGRVNGAGVTAAYYFEVGHTPVTMRGHLLKEFGAKNRVADGTAIFLSLDFPLHMRLPKQAQ